MHAPIVAFRVAWGIMKLMQKSTIIVAFFICFVGAALAVGYLVGDDEPSNDFPASRSMPDDIPAVAEDLPLEAPEVPRGDGFGDYVTWSDEAIAEAEGQVVLFFHADWCPQCRALETDIRREGVPAGYTFIKVDFDQYQDLRQRYEVTTQTTLVKVDDEGNKIDSYLAYAEPTLAAVQRDFLEN